MKHINENNEDNFEYDEIKQYINTRYICPLEAMYRLFQYPLHEMSHTIKRSAVHNKNEQNIYFREGSEEEIMHKNVETTLTVYLKLNEVSTEARTYLYNEIPNYYTYE